jgi:uncharacterized protein
MLVPLFLLALSCASTYLIMVVVIAHRFTTPKRISPSAMPAVANTTCERVHFPARGDGLSIAAWYRPVPSATAAVIMVHGRDACRSEPLRGDTFALVERLVVAGMTVLMIDLRGHGESGRARLTFGHCERLDVLGAVDFLLARGYAPSCIGVFGA